MPDSTQMLSRHFTAARSCVVKNTNDPTESQTRPILLDGRVRASPTAESKSSFALHWLISVTEDAKEANMERAYMETTCEVKMKISDHDIDYYQWWDRTDMPSVPVLLNPKAIAEHTQLVVKDDKAAQKIMEKDKEKASKDKEKEKEKEEADKSASTSAADSSAGKKRALVKATPAKAGSAKKPKI